MSAPDRDTKSGTDGLISKRPTLFWTLQLVATLGVAGFFMAAAPGTNACCAIPAICPVGSGSDLAMLIGAFGIVVHWLQKLLFRIPNFSTSYSAFHSFATIIPAMLLYLAARQIHLAFAC